MDKVDELTSDVFNRMPIVRVEVAIFTATRLGDIIDNHMKGSIVGLADVMPPTEDEALSHAKLDNRAQSTCRQISRVCPRCQIDVTAVAHFGLGSGR